MSYQSPVGLKTATYTVTKNDLLNSIVIPLFTCKIYLVSIISDSLYDGACALQGKATDGTFNDACRVTTQNQNDIGSNGRSKSQGDWTILNGSPFTLIPFQLRAFIQTKATQGTCTITVFFI